MRVFTVHFYPLLVLSIGCTDDTSSDGRKMPDGDVVTEHADAASSKLAFASDAQTQVKVGEPEPMVDSAEAFQASIQACGPAATDLAMIDDFDDGDANIGGDGRDGTWYDFDDGSGGSQTPNWDEGWTPSPGGVSAGGKALHVVGGGFTTWGAGQGLLLKEQNQENYCTYDISAWDGLAFWARGNPTSFSTMVVERDVIPQDEGGECDPNKGQCWDNHKVRTGLDDCWKLYAFNFNELRQDGWGQKTGELDLEEIVFIEFQIETDRAPNNRFDFWLDELQFFKGSKPSAEPICDTAPDAGPDAGAPMPPRLDARASSLPDAALTDAAPAEASLSTQTDGGMLDASTSDGG